MLRTAILAASRSHALERAVTHAPVSRDVVRRFVGGADIAAVLPVVRRLLDGGLTVTIDHLGEDTTAVEHAEAVTNAYLEMLAALDRAGLTARLGPLTSRAEVSVKLSAVGQRLDESLALANARRICAAADHVGAMVTLDMEDHTTTDSTLDVLLRLRADYPTTGAVLQAYLHRTESDCRELSGPGSRVRLCKGAYAEPPSVAYQKPVDVSKSYVRCVNVLLRGAGYPMFATHDPVLIDIATARARHYGKAQFEFQMLYGIRPDEQRRLAAAGRTVRVYVPYGAQWYGYLMRRLAERPANLGFFARAMLSKG